jgi:hypothetical protein
MTGVVTEVVTEVVTKVVAEVVTVRKWHLVVNSNSQPNSRPIVNLTVDQQ